MAGKVTGDKFVDSCSSMLHEGKLTVEALLGNLIRESKKHQHEKTFSGSSEGGHFPEKERFLFLSFHVDAVEKAVMKAFGEEHKETGRLKKLQKSLASLDDDCGTDIHLTPHMDEKEHSEGLAAIDADKLKFAGILKTGLKANEGGFQTFLIEWARLIYRFNEYQAEARDNPYQAQLDAMGLSDHFSELLDKLKKEIEAEKTQKETS